MAEPVIAQKGPFVVELEAGRTYWWCACGRSRNQPWCDGSHKEVGGITPIEYVTDRTRRVALCGCKRSAKRPICDGTHKSL